MDLALYLKRLIQFSQQTFGPGRCTARLLDHLRKELREVEQSPNEIEEWIDVALLALDGAWRHGYSPAEICQALAAKLAKNKARTWPDWRTQS